MRSSLVAALIAVVVLVGIAVLLFRDPVAETKPAPNAARPADDADRASDFRRLEAELERLSTEVRRLNRERAEVPIVPRSVEDRMPGSRPANTPGEVMPLPARWYLDQYVLSFEGGGTGSEYFRLAVDAYARELVEPIAALVVDAGRPDVLRQKLVAILGTPRFSGNSFVIDVFISLIQAGEPRNLALIALKVLPAVGGPGTVAVLEPLVWSVRTDDLAVAVLRTIAQLAGNGVNASLLRILTAASGTQIEVLRILMSLLNGSDPESALQCFVRASTMSQPIRLVAAHRIADFTDEPFKQYVAKWLGFETDPQVREVLERASKQQGVRQELERRPRRRPPGRQPRLRRSERLGEREARRRTRMAGARLLDAPRRHFGAHLRGQRPRRRRRSPGARLRRHLAHPLVRYDLGLVGSAHPRVRRPLPLPSPRSASCSTRPALPAGTRSTRSSSSVRRVARGRPTRRRAAATAGDRLRPTRSYVYLPEEAVDVWRPADAELVSPGVYRITSPDPDPEVELWQFDPVTSSAAACAGSMTVSISLPSRRCPRRSTRDD